MRFINYLSLKNAPSNQLYLNDFSGFLLSTLITNSPILHSLAKNNQAYTITI